MLNIIFSIKYIIIILYYFIFEFIANLIRFKFICFYLFIMSYIKNQILYSLNYIILLSLYLYLYVLHIYKFLNILYFIVNCRSPYKYFLWAP